MLQLIRESLTVKRSITAADKAGGGGIMFAPRNSTLDFVTNKYQSYVYLSNFLVYVYVYIPI